MTIVWLDWKHGVYLESWDGGDYMDVSVNGKTVLFDAVKPYKEINRFVKLRKPISD